MRKLLGSLVLLALALPSSAADVNDLIKKLSAKDNEVRREAAQGLGELGKDAKPAVDALTKALKDEDRFVRRFSAEALGKIGPDARSAIPGLTALLNDGTLTVREAAIRAIGKMGPDSIPALTKALSSTSDVQEQAVSALASSGPDGVPALTGAIKNPKMSVTLRRQAVDAVVKQGKDGRSAIGALTEVVKNARVGGGQEGNRFRIAAADGLGKLATKSDSSAIAALEEVTKRDKDNNQVKAAAKRALAAITSKK